MVAIYIYIRNIGSAAVSQAARTTTAEATLYSGQLHGIDMIASSPMLAALVVVCSVVSEAASSLKGP